MRARIMLAVLPAAVFAAAYAVQSRPGKSPEPKQTYAEQVYGGDSFEQRFGRPPDPTVKSVRTVTILPVKIAAAAAQPVAEVQPVPEPVATPAPARRLVRKVSLEQAVCRRHNMRTVHYGKRWRCRR